jgi:hypothetical protein
LGHEAPVFVSTLAVRSATVARRSPSLWRLDGLLAPGAATLFRDGFRHGFRHVTNCTQIGVFVNRLTKLVRPPWSARRRMCRLI